MEIMSYTQLRKNLASAIDDVCNNHVPVIITKQNGSKAVLINFDDYLSHTETDYLMSNPVNAERLRRGIAEFNAGLTKPNKELMK